MYIETLTIEGFRCFDQEFEINFNSGLNVLVGENGAGKTGIISALRQLFVDSESGRYSVTEQDFHKAFSNSAQAADSFAITGAFEDLSDNEKIAFLPWCDLNGQATLNLHVNNKETRGRYKRSLWGGKSKLSAFESETIDLIHCIYLPPLRDAEAKLKDGRQSRLSKLLKALSKKELNESRDKGELHPLEQKVADFNEELSTGDEYGIKQANELISKNLKQAVGHHFSQSTLIQFSENDFSKIVEGLRLLFFPNLNNKDQSLYRSLQENSLGYNNLLYIASILAELIAEDESEDEQDRYFKLLLIEEPEAHLHPQLQIRLLNYLSEVAERPNVQVLVTTHSTVLASAVSINSLIHLTNQDCPIATPLASCGLPQKSVNFIDRWLDVTKSNLLFAQGVILVEGIAEAILIPELAKIILEDEPEGRQSLEDLGVSVINLNGIYFEHFMRLYCNLPTDDEDDADQQEYANIPIRCAGLTDRDPDKEEGPKDDKALVKPHYDDKHEGKNHALKLIDDIEKSEYARLFANELKTFEYDFAMEGNNIPVMAKVLLDNWPKATGSKRKSLQKLANQKIDWSEKTQPEKADAAHIILQLVDDSVIGKGLFAQLFADELSDPIGDIEVPSYIVEAVQWACGVEIDD